MTAIMRRHLPTRFIIPMALVVLCAGYSGVAWSEARPAAAALADQVTTTSSILVGVVVDGREVGSIEIIRVGEVFRLPLEEVTHLLGATTEEIDGATVVTTPIGRITLAGGEAELVNGVVMVDLEFFERRLATEVVFDRQEFALRFTVPWTLGEPGELVPARALGPPDFTPPRATIATLQADLRATRQADADFYSGSAIAEGRLASGWWRLRYDDDFAGRHRLEEYSWLQTRERRQLLFGYQRVRLHPLFDTLDMTGAQVAYTNVDLDFFSRSREARELLSRRTQSLTTVRGVGPPGGLAELRIDGIPFDRRTIALNGTYEFNEVLLPSRQATRIEVYVFDRSNLLIPIAIVDETRWAFDLLMDDGALVQQGGLGAQGNLATDDNREAIDGEAGGFYQIRYGISDRLTVEATAQRIADRFQVEAGLVARLGRGLVASLSGASSDGALGYDLELSGQWRRWWVQARSIVTEEGFHLYDTGEEYNHYLEVGFDPRPNLDLSVIARRRQSPSGNADFILPTISWRPGGNVSLRIYPDLEGRYLGNLWWRINRKTRFAMDVLEDLSASTELTRDIGSRSALQLGADLRSGLPDRYSAIFRTDLDFAARTTIAGGLMFSDDNLGYDARATIGIDPGFILNIELRDDPSLRGTDGNAGRRYFIGLSIDLGFAGGRVIPAHRGAVRDDRGAIAGVVRPTAGTAGAYPPLENVLVVVDGRRGGRTDRTGAFFIGRLTEGIHSVELDLENLPIELVPDRTRWVVEVAHGAVTRVDFTVRPEFGIAGRLTDAAGRRLSGRRIAVVGDDGSIIGSGVTDQFGLYRVDGVPAGSYTVRTGDNAESMVTRSVEVTDDFLFGQDLVLSFEVPEAPPDD